MSSQEFEPVELPQEEKEKSVTLFGQDHANTNVIVGEKSVISVSNVNGIAPVTERSIIYDNRANGFDEGEMTVVLDHGLIVPNRNKVLSPSKSEGISSNLKESLSKNIALDVKVAIVGTRKHNGIEQFTLALLPEWIDGPVVEQMYPQAFEEHKKKMLSGGRIEEENSSKDKRISNIIPMRQNARKRKSDSPLVEAHKNKKSQDSSGNSDENDDVKGTSSKRKRSSMNPLKVMLNKKRANKISYVESDDDREKEYIVEAILDMRNEDGENLYLVHWEGYSSDYDSWEPIDDLKNLKVFKQFQSRQKEKTKEETTKNRSSVSNITEKEDIPKRSTRSRSLNLSANKLNAKDNSVCSLDLTGDDATDIISGDGHEKDSQKAPVPILNFDSSTDDEDDIAAKMDDKNDETVETKAPVDEEESDQKEEERDSLDQKGDDNDATQEGDENRERDDSEEDDDKEYEVEDALDARLKKNATGKGKNSYEIWIKWKGFGPKYNTWEPYSNVKTVDCVQKLINEKLEDGKASTSKNSKAKKNDSASTSSDTQVRRSTRTRK